MIVSPTLPAYLLDVDRPFIPTKVLGRRHVDQDGKVMEQVLIKWQGLSDKEITGWMGQIFEVNFQNFALGTRLFCRMGASDSSAPKRKFIVYSRRKKE